MRYVKIALGVTLAVLVYAFLDYALPSKHTVYITDTDSRLTYISPSNSIFYASDDTGTVENQQGQRDIRFINTIKPNGGVLVFRNEDTGWIWPPYFKYDSANLQAEASNLKSTQDNPKWVSVTSYGWRVAWMSIYPNAISVKPVSGPDDRPTNWGALIVLGVLMALLLLFWRMWAQFRQRTIDPAVKRVDDAWDSVETSAADARDYVSGEVTEARGRFRRWLDSWKGKPRP